MKLKKHSQSSKKWLNRHFSDPYVKKARQAGFYSRAVFKLQEIQQKYAIIQTSSIVLDLGAAPGAFSQYALSIAQQGQVIASDILPIKTIKAKNFSFIQGDFRDKTTYEQILAQINEKQLNVLLSDMAPNMSGKKALDLPRSMYLVELAYQMAMDLLDDNGFALIKIFQGKGFSELITQAKKDFNMVKVLKPEASYQQSKEMYLLLNAKKDYQFGTR